MYNTQNGFNDLFNKMAITAVLAALFYKIADPETDTVVVDSREYDPDERDDFCIKLANNPEAIEKLLNKKESKNNFLCNVMDDHNKPLAMSPESFYDLYKSTLCFLFDKKVLYPAVDDKKEALYSKKYGEVSFEYREFVIAMSLYEYITEIKDDWDCKVRDIIEDIEDTESFKDACMEAADAFHLDNAQEYIDKIVEATKEAAEDFIADTDDDDFDEAWFYKEKFKDFFGDQFCENYMYDSDFEFLLNENLCHIFDD